MGDLRLSRTEALSVLSVGIVGVLSGVTWQFGAVGLLCGSLAVAAAVLFLPIKG